jgi:hypothetical protein
VHDKDTFAACIRAVLARTAARGDRVLLALDEAQGLGHELLREVGDLSALAAASGHSLFILLIGETRLTAALKDDQHAGLRAHIIARCAVPALGLDEVGAYVRHNLDAAGAVTEVFSPEAIRTIASLSRGAPGAINILGDRALLVGRARRARPITAAIVSECGRSPESPSAADTGVDRSSPRPTSVRSRAEGRGRLYVTIAATANRSGGQYGHSAIDVDRRSLEPSGKSRLSNSPTSGMVWIESFGTASERTPLQRSDDFLGLA